MNNLDSLDLQQARPAFFGTALRTCAAVLALALACHGSSSGRAETVTPPSAPASAVSQSSPAGEGPLRAGVARAPQEILRCRQEESARAHEQPPPRIVAPAEPVRLRSTPLDLPASGCEESVKRWNFYSEKNQVNGCFVNAYVNYGFQKLIVPDLSTGLMWEVAGSNSEITFERAQRRIREMDAEKWAGFSGWRLPTTEEFLSILEAFEFEIYHLDKEFFVTGSGWWTSDYYAAGKKRWVIETASAGCSTLSPEYEAPVRAVRTMSKQELEEARKKFEKGK